MTFRFGARLRCARVYVIESTNRRLYEATAASEASACPIELCCSSTSGARSPCEFLCTRALMDTLVARSTGRTSFTRCDGLGVAPNDRMLDALPCRGRRREHARNGARARRDRGHRSLWRRSLAPDRIPPHTSTPCATLMRPSATALLTVRVSPWPSLNRSRCSGSRARRGKRQREGFRGPSSLPLFPLLSHPAAHEQQTRRQGLQ